MLISGTRTVQNIIATSRRCKMKTSKAKLKKDGWKFIEYEFSFRPDATPVKYLVFQKDNKRIFYDPKYREIAWEEENEKA